jgi:Ni/Fe-hydrogenase 1 B-type cytochrome subunit
MEQEYIYTWSRTDRIVHWTITLAVAVLTLTGFYIHWPFIEGGAPGGVDVMAWMRFAHFVGAYAVILGLIVRVYLAFASHFDADWREFSLWRNLRSVPDILGYYLFLKRGHKEYRRYNPLQALTYLFWLILILFLSLTGFALYHGNIFGILSAPEAFGWVNTLLGGESYTRIWHYLAMWVFLITVAVHVYMAAMTGWTNRDHTFRSIFTGYKVKTRRA